MTKKTKGLVGIEEYRDKLRLRLPRSAATKLRYLNTGLDVTKENRKTAQKLAWQIEEDIQTDTLDPTLNRYRLNINTQELDLLQLWERYCQYRKPMVAATTYHQEYETKYTYRIKQLPTYSLTQAVAIRDYLVANKTANMAKRIVRYINACCSWALRSGLIATNPFKDMVKEVRAPRRRKQLQPFSQSEKVAIIDAFRAHPEHSYYAPLVEFLFLTGCRPGEALALRWKHVDWSSNTLTFAESYSATTKVFKATKTGVVRQFPVNASLLRLLRSIKSDTAKLDDLVFPNPQGMPLRLNTFTSRVWKGRVEGNKVYRGVVGELVKEGKVTCFRCPYNIRHTYITMALEAGVPVTLLAQWVGNSPAILMHHYAGTLVKMDSPVH